MTCGNEFFLANIIRPQLEHREFRIGKLDGSRGQNETRISLNIVESSSHGLGFEHLHSSDGVVEVFIITTIKSYPAGIPILIPSVTPLGILIIENLVNIIGHKNYVTINLVLSG